MNVNIQAFQVKKWLTSELLLNWLDKHRIFDIVFGDSLHSEVIKKSYTLLDFLYKNGRLQTKQFDKMWECATKKHEAYKVGILKALTFLATIAKIEDLQYLFGKMKLIPLSEVDKFCLDLTKAIAKKLVGDESMAVESPTRTTNLGGRASNFQGPPIQTPLPRSNSSDGHVK